MTGQATPLHTHRYREIAGVLARHGLGYLVGLSGHERHVPFQRGLLGHPRRSEPYTRPEHVRLAFEELGATFIKLGQILSTRSDLLPPAYLTELARLQDAVPPVPSDQIEVTLVAELGRPITEAFATFDPTPLAAASIGQVHRATLADGVEVVVKVRRPGVVEQIEGDLEILHNLAARASRHWEVADQYDVVGLVAEFSETLRTELDYLREGHSAERIAANFADDPTVHIPRVFWETTTARVLTLERVRGMKVTDLTALDASGIDRKALAARAANITLKMIFADGFFHADPHPGNFFIAPDGAIALIDFGMVGVVDERTRTQLVGILFAVTSQDADRLADVLIEIGVARGPVDRALLRQDLDHLLTHYYNQPLGDLAIGPLLNETFAIIRRHYLQLPTSLALLLKTFVMSEGVAAQLDPDFSLIGTLTPYARQMMVEENSPQRWARRIGKASLDAGDLAVALPHQVRRLLGELERGELVVGARPEGFAPVMRHVERLVNRIVLGLLASSFIIGLAVLMTVYHPAGNQGWTGAFFAVGFVLAALLGLSLAWSILRSGRR